MADARMRLRSQMFQQSDRQSRFSNTGFTGKKHDFALAGLGFRPAPQQQFEFFFTTD